MSKLSLIIKREYLAKVRNKSFVVMTFLSPILMVGMVVLIVYLTKINDNQSKTIGVLNESDYFSTDFQSTEGTSFLKLKDINVEAAKDSIMGMGYYGLLYIPEGANLEVVTNKAVFYSKDAPGSTLLENLENVFEESSAIAAFTGVRCFGIRF